MYIYIYIYIYILQPNKSGVKNNSVRTNHSKIECLNFLSKELNVNDIIEQIFFSEKKKFIKLKFYKIKDMCPMNGLCNLEKVVYKGIIFPKENVKSTKIYVGISSTKWKQRLNNHNHSFSLEIFKNKTALSKHLWKLKNKGLTLEIQWRILSTTLRTDVIFCGWDAASFVVEIIHKFRRPTT